MMHIFCKWGLWGPLMTRNMVHVNYMTGIRTPFVEVFQRRCCQKCEKVNERVV